MPNSKVVTLMETQNDDFLPGVCSSGIVSTSPDRPHHPGVFFITEYCCEGLTWNWKSFPSLERPWCWERLESEGEGTTEDEVVGWHHWLNRHEFEKTPGDGEGQGSLACCNPQGHKESDITERLNNNNTAQFLSYQVSMATCVTRKLAQGQIYP